MTTIADVLAASNTTPPPSTGQSETVSGGELGKNDFLKLLVAQLQNQDPLKPTDNDAFIMESAAFSQVQQLTDLVSLTKQLVDKQNAASAPASPPATTA